jgi:aspartokinase
MAEVFKMIADAGIDVDMISQFPASGSSSGFSFTVSDNDFIPVLAIASKLREINPKTKISVSSGNCKLTVSGEEMRGTPGVSATVFKAVSSVDADVRMITTSESEIAMHVVKSDVDAVIEAIKKEFAE